MGLTLSNPCAIVSHQKLDRVLPCSPQMEQTKKPRGSRPLEERHHCLRDSAWNLRKGEKMMMQHMAGFQSLGAHFAGWILLKKSRDISQIWRKPLLVAAPEVLAANLTSLRRVQAQPTGSPQPANRREPQSWTMWAEASWIFPDRSRLPFDEERSECCKKRPLRILLCSRVQTPKAKMEQWFLHTFWKNMQLNKRHRPARLSLHFLPGRPEPWLPNYHRWHVYAAIWFKIRLNFRMSSHLFCLCTTSAKIFLGGQPVWGPVFLCLTNQPTNQPTHSPHPPFQLNFQPR